MSIARGRVLGAAAVKAAQREARKREAATTRAMFFAQLAAERVPLPEYEYGFHADREWRFDYAWPAQKVALEIDGGIWTQGRHTRGSGWLKDAEKLNTAASMGWRMLRTTPDGLHDLSFIRLIRDTLSPRDP